MADFVLHPRLEAGGFEIARIHGCRVLLKNEAKFPWFIVVPEVPEGIEEFHQLDGETFRSVTGLIRDLSGFVSGHFSPDKINVGCIGNKVRQMHIHVVARSSGDPAWPGVVWSFEGKTKYDVADAEEIIAAAKRFFETQAEEVYVAFPPS